MPHPALKQTDHRPWPLPAAAWTWRQSWRDLLFAHWPVPVAAVRALVPPALDIDTYDGRTYIGLVPFRMAGVMRRPLPDLPYVSAFPEFNVRVYVTDGRKPGVWFLSLDATNRLAVAAARALFHLPYYRARMSVLPHGDGILYRSTRLDPTGGLPVPATFSGSYRPASPVYSADPGSLDQWLTERYCLYAGAPDGTLRRTEVHHAPWPLQRAEAHIVTNTISAAGGLPVEGPPPLLHFARRIDVVVWDPEKLGAGGVESS
jgi:uncharacterized protein YqjF (DUF2071 family)